MNNYIVYHLHSNRSLLDSATDFKDYIDYATSLGQTAIAFTEHGNNYNWFAKKQYAESKGLKYIHGVECYLTETFETNIRDNYHTILLAKNYDGFIEINRLIKLSSRKDHVYYKRRLSFDEFLAISDNVIKISACLLSPLNKYRKADTFNEDILDKLLRHYDYYEIQYHFGEQIEYNQYLYEMSKRYNKPLIAATDTHSLNEYKAKCRTVLQYGKTDGSWGDDENECDLTYKTYDELVEAFEKQNSLPMDIVMEAINNTNVMADSVEEFTIDTKNKYPELYGDKDEEKLWDVIKEKLKNKIQNGIIQKDQRYADNIREEMRVFKKIDMIGFMLFMSEIMSWARDNHIATGFARGSVAGSTVAYITDITDVDPVKWNTIFSRFANENRVEAGDIDTDWYEDDRQKVYDYIIDRFGSDKTAYVFAAGTLADKSVIDTIGKAYRVKAEKEGTTTEYTLEKIKEIKEEYDKDKEETIKKYPDIFKYYDGLEGCVISQSQHPAGIIVSSVNLTDWCSGFYNADGQVVLPLDMDECHDMGQIKYDILGLKSVGVIDKTYKMIGKVFPRADQVDWNDQEVYADIAKDNTAIFQFESDYSGQCLMKYKPKSVEELSVVNACIRPSGETYRDELLARHIKNNPSKLIADLLSDTGGFLCYQEQIIAFLQEICGFSGSEADSIRRAIGKKLENVIDEALPKILEGYCNKSDKPREIAEKEAKEFLDVIYHSSSYMFGYNHSLSYSMLSYLMGYLRYHYPVQFCTSFMNCAKNDDDVSNGTKLALSRGCTISPIKFGHSKGEYNCDAENKVIYKGMNSVKYLSPDLADQLYELRNNHYDSFIDLLYDIKQTVCNSRQLKVLIALNFFEEFGNPGQLFMMADVFERLYKRKQIKMSDLGKLGIPLEIMQDISQKQTEKMFKDFDSKELIRRVVEITPWTQTRVIDKMRYEGEYLGYIQTKMPKLPKKYWYVTERKQIGKNQLLTLHRLCNGEQKKMKVRAKVFANNKVNDHDIIQISETAMEKKWKMGADGKFYQINEREEILKIYTVIPNDTPYLENEKK